MAHRSVCRQVTNSVGEAVVLDPAFDWGNDDFRAPAWNAMTIYEMHVGTFTAGPNGEPGDFDWRLSWRTWRSSASIRSW